MLWCAADLHAARRGVRAVLFALGVVLCSVRSARAVKVSVRANATLEARVTNDGDAQVIRGTLKDDVGAPVPGARVEVEIVGTAGERIDLPPPRPCGANTGGSTPHAAADAYVLDTDVRGVFCVRTSPIAARGTLRVRFAGVGPISGTSLETPFDADLRVPTLAWDPRPELVDLDVPQLRVVVVATGRAGGRGLDGIALVLVDERGQVLARARTDERGRATFDVATASLGAPGAGELSVRTDAPGQAPLAARVLRVARVGLVTAAPSDPIVPHDGHTFDVAAETGRGPVENGAIEARIGEETVGAGTVRAGRAAVTTTFDVPTEGALELSFRYLTATPELRPGEPLGVRVHVRPPSAWRRAPLLALALLLGAWIARGWRRAPRSAEAARRSLPPPARLPDLVAEPDGGARGWRGTVLDAHERRPIAGASVRVVSRDFLAERALAEVVSAEDGSFALDVAMDPTHAIVVDAPLHGRVEKPLPRPGRLTIALVSRRRALLDRLLASVRRSGLVPSAPPEPTPGLVARAAETRARPVLARWALAVEDAAYGEAPFDVEAEARVAALEPRDTGAPPPKLGNER